LSFALHFGADVVVAALTTRAPGYDRASMPSIGDLALFYVTRSRLAWIPLTLIGFHKSWNSLAKQTMIIEAISQIMGCYYLGRTADFATQHGYYQHLHYSHRAQLMYFGALFTLIFSLGAVVALIFTVVALERAAHKPGRSMRTCVAVALSAGFAAVFGITAFIGRWIFLIGFVTLMEDSYCPPSLINQVAIWVSMNVAGMIIGAGH
jgi:hypothetical protein